MDNSNRRTRTAALRAPLDEWTEVLRLPWSAHAGWGGPAYVVRDTRGEWACHTPEAARLVAAAHELSEAAAAAWRCLDEDAGECSCHDALAAALRASGRPGPWMGDEK